jgi:cytochrome o ubiquinol oxidase subunit IV
MIDQHHGWNLSFKPLILGFVLSLISILAAYRMVAVYHLVDWALTVTVFGLAASQAIFQLVFFLHLGLEAKPRWNVAMFLFMLLVITVVIGGSVWIMHNLNYNVMPDMQAGHR